VPSEMLKPRNTWASGADYDAQAKKLATMFVENFKTFEQGVTSEVLAAGRTRRIAAGALVSLHWDSPSHQCTTSPVMFEAVIGLENHAQLLTASKIFCAPAQAFGGERIPTSARSASGCRAALPSSIVPRWTMRFARRWRSAARSTSLDLRAQELFLSGPAEGLSDFAIRAAPRHRRADGRCASRA